MLVGAVGQVAHAIAHDLRECALRERNPCDVRGVQLLSPRDLIEGNSARTTADRGGLIQQRVGVGEAAAPRFSAPPVRSRESSNPSVSGRSARHAVNVTCDERAA